VKILALDVGTSSVKAAILETESAAVRGRIVRAEYSLDHPTPDAAEVRPDVLWGAIDTAARQACTGNPGIEGVGLSCLTPALVLLDAADEPLAPIWIHLDRRSRPLARRVWEAVGSEFLHSVGNRPLPGGMSVLCYRQQADQDPTLAGRVRRYLHVNGWVGLKLTGATAFDRGGACFTGLFGTLTDQRWSSRWCEYFGVDPTWLPPVVCGSTTLSGLRAEMAAAWGVPAGIPVKLGTADTSSAMLACGLGPGDLLHVVGTTQVLGVEVAQPRPDPRRLTRLLGVGTRYVYVVHNPLGGVALDWLHQLCFQDQTRAQFFSSTMAQALAAIHKGVGPERPALDPPFLGGDRLNIETSTAAFRNLTLSTTRLDLLVTLLREMRKQHDQAVANLDLPGPIRRVILTGGGAEVVRKLIPAYEQLPLQTLEEGSLRGVAQLFRL
jgi:xylulokinase